MCFTTMDWCQYVNDSNTHSDSSEDANNDGTSRVDNLPPIPDESLDTGVLPRVIKSLVDRRKAVKKMLKNENNADKRQEVQIQCCICGFSIALMNLIDPFLSFTLKV